MPTIADNLQEIVNIKGSIKEAIRYQQQPVLDSDGFATYPAKIANINDINIELQDKSITVTQNGTQTVTPDTGYNALSSVEITTQFDGNLVGLDSSQATSVGSSEITSRFLKSITSIDFANTNFSTYSYMFASMSALVRIGGTFDCTGKTVSSMFRGCSSLAAIPTLTNTGNALSMDYMFAGCKAITSIPLIDTSSVTSAQHMFSNCSALTTIPALNMSNAHSFQNMFYKCSALTNIQIPSIGATTDAQNGHYYMFYDCSSLISTPSIDISGTTTLYGMFYNCSSLVTINFVNTSNASTIKVLYNAFYGCTSLRTINGAIDVGANTNWTGVFGGDANTYTTLLEEVRIKKLKVGWNISYLINLSHDSLVYLINNLQTVSSTKTLTIGATNVAKLTEDEIAVGTNKGWTIK